MKLRVTKRQLLFAAIITLAVLFFGFEIFLLSADFRRLFVAGAERTGSDEFLVGRLSDRDTDVRGAASEALVRRGEKAVPVLVRELDSPDPLARSLASLALKQIGPVAREARPALWRVAKTDPDDHVREEAARAFGEIGRDDPVATDELVRMLEAGDAAERLAAARAVSFVGDGETRQGKAFAGDGANRVVPGLTRALADPDPKLREEAAEALGAVGVPAKSAIPALLNLLRDPDPRVRSEVDEALRKIIYKLGDGDGPLISQVNAALEQARPQGVPPGGP